MNRIIEKSFDKFNEEENILCETLFHNANGYIGVRGSLEEGLAHGINTMRGMYINGFYDIIPMKQAENLCNFVDKKDTMINVADTMTIEISINGCCFNLFEGKILEYTRTLDMDKGITRRHILWRSPKGHTVEVNFKRMTSFEKRALFLIETEIKACDFAGTVTINSKQCGKVRNYSNPKDPRLAAESMENMIVEAVELTDSIGAIISHTSTSNLKMCSLVYHDIALRAKSFVNETISAGYCCDKDNGVNTFTYETFLDEGDCVVLNKYTIITDSLRHEDVLGAARGELEEVLAKGTAYYYEAQAGFLVEFWKQSEINIYGDERTHRAVEFNLYQMLQSAPGDNKCSVAAKGLSGEGYEGHYFWDTETFVLPFFIMTNPKPAKEILSYRHRTLEKARENARLLGHKKGALYPWRTITGAECSGYFVSGSCAYHINADIAYAVVSYYLATGDNEFIIEKGEEILIETARLWMDLGCYNRNGDYVLNAVTGPDEYTCMVNNNYYTNCAAKFNIEWAVKLYELMEESGDDARLADNLRLSVDEISQMKKAADRMLLLYDEKLGINPQDDSFLDKPVWDLKATPKSDFPLLLNYHPLHLYRYQVCKQADTVLAYFMFEDRQKLDVMRRSYEYYEKITTHDSSLSTCVFSIVASRLGMQKKGYEYFGDSAKLDLENTHNNSAYGIHTANMGGCYMAIVNGFAGVRIGENGLSLAPFVPGNWSGYDFNIMYRERHIRISVTLEDVEIKLMEGPSFTITVYGVDYMLDDIVKVQMPEFTEA